MKLAPIDSAEVYRMLDARLTREMAAINSVLKRNAEESRRLLAVDRSEINANIQTLKLGVEAAKDNATQSLKSGLAALEKQLYAIDLSGTVEGIQSQVANLTAGITGLMHQAGEDDETEVEGETLQFLLDEIKRLESRIEYDKQRQLPYLAMQSIKPPPPIDSGEIFDGEMLNRQIQGLRLTVQNLIDDLIQSISTLANQDLQIKELSTQQAIRQELDLMNERIEEAFQTQIVMSDISDKS